MNKYIRIAVSVLAIGFIGWRTNWTVVGAKFANLHIGMWLAAVGILVAAQFASARRWQLFSRELRFERSFSQYCAYYFIGMYFSLLLPTSVGGDGMRVWYLNNKSGRMWAALASVFLDRLNGLLVLIGVACFGVLIVPVELPSWILASVWTVAGCAALGVASIPFTRKLSLIPQQRREQLQLVWDLLRSPRMMAEATFMSILVQLAGVASLWCLGEALGLNVAPAYYCVLGPMVSLLMLLPLSVNGMGFREGGTVLFLAPLGVDEATALTLAFLWFALGVTGSLLGGLVYVFGADSKAQPTQEDTNDHGSLDRDSDQGREGQLTKAA